MIGISKKTDMAKLILLASLAFLLLVELTGADLNCAIHKKKQASNYDLSSSARLENAYKTNLKLLVGTFNA